MFRSRTLRRVYVKTPGGENKLHYKKRKPSKAVCGSCKNELKGVPRLRPNDLKKLSKTERRPQRPYGGVLCSSCMRKQIITNLR